MSVLSGTGTGRALDYVRNPIHELRAILCKELQDCLIC